MKKKTKILISTIALVGGAMPLGAFVCATGTSNVNNPTNPDAEDNLDWQNQGTAYGDIVIGEATRYIATDTQFGMLTLPQVTPKPNCHFGGWFGTIGSKEQLLTYSTVIPAVSSGQFIISAHFYPDIKDISIPANLTFTKQSGQTGSGTIQCSVEWKDSALTVEPKYKWKLADPSSSVLSIDSALGDDKQVVNLNLLAEGSEQVIITVDNGGQLFSKTCNVTVRNVVDPVEGMFFSKDQAGLDPIHGTEFTYESTPKPAEFDFYYHLLPSSVKPSASDVTFTLLDPDAPLIVAVIDPDNDPTHIRVSLDTTKTISTFKTLIIATYSKDDVEVSNTFEVVVKKAFVPINSIKLSTDKQNLNPSETGIITATVEGKSDQDIPTYPDAISWSSSKPSLVKVDKDGNITASSTETGEATITVKAVDDPKSIVSASIIIRVADLNWTVNVSTDKQEWIDGEWDIHANDDDDLSVTFNTDQLYHKVKPEDVQITYLERKLDKGEFFVDQVGKEHKIIIPKRVLQPSLSRSIDIVFTVKEYYTVYLESGVGVSNISITDIPAVLTGGQTFDGTVQFDGASALCLDNCYAVWGNRLVPAQSKKYFGEDAIGYKADQPLNFQLKVPSDIATISTHEVTLHLDASNAARWLDIDVTEADHVYIGLEKNNFDGDEIQFNFSTENGFRLDLENTTVSINGESYNIDSTKHIFELKNGSLLVHPKEAEKEEEDFDAGVEIILNPVVIANDFDCTVAYADPTLFDATGFAVVSAIDDEDVVIKVKTSDAKYLVVVDDAEKLYAIITLKDDLGQITITDLTVGEVDTDGKTPITMAYPSEEYIGKIKSIEFHVAAYEPK